MLERVFDLDHCKHEKTKAKTELCRAILQPSGYCNFKNCHFAHSIKELRPKILNKTFFKQTKCMKFSSGCKYGPRCSYIHDEKSYKITNKTTLLFSQAERVFRIVHDHGNNGVAVYTLETDGNYQEKIGRDLIETLWAFVKEKHRDKAVCRGSTPRPQALRERKLPIIPMSREGTPHLPSPKDIEPRLQGVLQLVATNIDTAESSNGSETDEKHKLKRNIMSERRAGMNNFATPEKTIDAPVFSYSSRSSSPESSYWSTQIVQPFELERPDVDEDWLVVRERLQSRIQKLEQENFQLRSRLYIFESCQESPL